MPAAARRHRNLASGFALGLAWVAGCGSGWAQSVDLGVGDYGISIGDSRVTHWLAPFGR